MNVNCRRRSDRANRRRWKSTANASLGVLLWLIIPAICKADDYDFGSLIGDWEVWGQNTSIGTAYAGSVYVQNGLTEDDYREGSISLANPYNIITDFGGYQTYNYISILDWALVGGATTVNGTNLTYSKWDGWHGLLPGVVISVQIEEENPTQITFAASSDEALWRWRQNAAIEAADQMTLDSSALTLLDSSTGNTLIWCGDRLAARNPGAGSVAFYLYSPQILDEVGFGGIHFGNYIPYVGSLILNEVSLSTDQYFFDFSVYTRALFTSADFENAIAFDPNEEAMILQNGFTLYGDLTHRLFSLGGLGFAIGQNATASGMDSIAFGANVSASGSGALAFSSATASGDFAVALGNGSVASGASAVALVGGTASGGGSVAQGYTTTASADWSVALGAGMNASNWGAVTFGHYNTSIFVSGSDTVWKATAPAFIVGTGNATTRGNALVILNNGNATFTGNTSLAAGSQTQGLEVDGTSTFNGSVTISANVTFSRALGDVPMGAFGR